MRKPKEDEPEAALRAGIKDLPPKKKLEYFIMYYKWVIVLVIAVIIAIPSIVQWIQNIRTKVFLNVAVVNGFYTDVDAIVADIEDTLDLKGKYETASVLANVTADSESGELDYYAQMAFVAQVQARTIDIFIVPEALGKSLEAQETLATFGDLFDAKTLEELGLKANECLVELEDSPINESLLVNYSPVYAAVFIGSQNMENAKAWLMHLLKD